MIKWSGSFPLTNGSGGPITSGSGSTTLVCVGITQLCRCHRFWSGYEVNLAVVIRFLSPLIEDADSSIHETVPHEFFNFIINVSKERRIFLNTKIVLEADQDPGGTLWKKIVVICTFKLFYVSPLPFLHHITDERMIFRSSCWCTKT
jgi:hypothetical protein